MKGGAAFAFPSSSKFAQLAQPPSASKFAQLAGKRHTAF